MKTASDSLISLLLRYSSEAIIFLNKELRIELASQEFTNIFYTQKNNELINLSLSQLGLNEIEELIKSKPKKEITSFLSLDLPEIENHYFDIKIAPISLNNIYYIVFFTNITVTLDQEKKLLHSNEELSVLYEMSQLSVKKTKDETILNNAFEQFSLLTSLEKGFFIPNNKSKKKSLIYYNLKTKDIERINKYSPNFSHKQANIIIFSENIHKLTPILKDMQFAIAVSFPVYCEKEKFGTMFFLSTKNHLLRFSNLKFYNLVGYQIGLAIEKADLFNKIEYSAKEIMKKNEILNDEMLLAQKMQTELLSIELPNKEGAKFAIKYIPSYRLSGDFYDIFEISENRLGVIIADVCGHGINAALITTFLKASVHEMSKNCFHPNELLNKLNKKLSEVLSSKTYVTAYYMIIDLNEKKISYSNGGHPYPIFYNKKQNKLEELKIDGTLLSVTPFSEYVTATRKIHAGDKIVLFTDGIFDIRNRVGDFIPKKNITELILKNQQCQGDELITKILKEMYDFKGSSDFEDDINLIIIDIG